MLPLEVFLGCLIPVEVCDNRSEHSGMVSEGVFYLPCVIYGGMCLVNKGEKPGMLQGESHEQAGCQPLHG